MSSHSADPNQQLFFVALLPPQPLQDQVTEIKQYFSQTFNSRAALKSPPHITLHPPFPWPTNRRNDLVACLTRFALQRSPLQIQLDGFAAFPPRVIYLHISPTADLIRLHSDLAKHLETELNLVDPKTQTRSFKPHMTVAFRDLTPKAFKTAWPEFQHRSFQADFLATDLTLLVHHGQRWQIHIQLRFPNG